MHFLHRPPDEIVGDVMYLSRWYVWPKNRFFKCYLHKMVGPDEGRHVHDHPWSFLSIILVGGYCELVATDKLQFKYNHCRWFNFKRATDFHRIVSLDRKTVWTLVFTGPRNRTWGFMTKHGWVDWDTYIHHHSKPLLG